LEAVRQNRPKAARAWAIKKQFSRFWQYVYSPSAEEFFDQQYARGVWCCLRPIVRAAKPPKRYMPIS
jgi:hypothetical protein